MSPIDSLTRSPDEWNHPRWPQVYVPVAAGVGAVVASLAGDALGHDSAVAAGVGAGLAVIVAWFVFAALDDRR